MKIMIIWHYSIIFMAQNQKKVLDFRLNTILNLMRMKMRLSGIDLQSLTWHPLYKGPTSHNFC